MGKLKTKEMPLWAQTGHGKPVTRRDFLACGMIPFVASALVPGALGLLGTPFQARAEENCATGQASSLIPFITMNLAGGASLSSNFVPRNEAGDLLPSYTKMGLGNNTGANALTMVSEFGVESFSQISSTAGMIAGIRATADPATLANTAFIAFCVQSQDDTGNNKLDASGMVFKSGLVGSMMPNMGMQSTPTGINQKASTIAPPSPLVVRSFTDLTSSIGYTRSLASVLTTDQRERVAKLVNRLSASQTEKLNSISSVAGVQSLVNCAGIKNVDLIKGGAAAIDPLNNAAVAQRWAINAGTGANNENRVVASMVYNGLLGNAGVVNIQRGGYDYHNGTRNTGNQKDNEAGQMIGRILDTARLLNKKIFLYVTSDGSVVSNEADAPGAAWVSDRGSAGLAMAFLYDPAGRPATTGFQVGQYTAGQVADDKTVVGNSPELATQAVFANYLKFNGRMDLFSSTVPNGTLDGAILNGVIKVG